MARALNYETCECASSQGERGKATKERKPLREVWVQNQNRNKEDAAAAEEEPVWSACVGLSRKPALNLKWDCCGASVTLCDCCGNLINVSDELLDEVSFKCKHCSFPVLVNNKFRRLLSLQPFSQLAFEEVVDAQIKLVGKATYTQFKANSLASIENELKGGSFPASPNKAGGGKRKRNQNRKESGSLYEQRLANDSRKFPARREGLGNRYIQMKWELMALNKKDLVDSAGHQHKETRTRTTSTTTLMKEELAFLRMLYSEGRIWPDFWEVHHESSKNVRHICDLAVEFLSNRRERERGRERDQNVLDIQSCLSEDLNELFSEARGAGLGVNKSSGDRRESETKTLLTSLLEKEGEKMKQEQEEWRVSAQGLQLKIQAELENIIRGCQAAADDGTPKLFPSQAYHLYKRLYRTCL